MWVVRTQAWMTPTLKSKKEPPSKQDGLIRNHCRDFHNLFMSYQYSEMTCQYYWGPQNAKEVCTINVFYKGIKCLAIHVRAIVLHWTENKYVFRTFHQFSYALHYVRLDSKNIPEVAGMCFYINRFLLSYYGLIGVTLAIPYKKGPSEIPLCDSVYFNCPCSLQSHPDRLGRGYRESGIHSTGVQYQTK